MMKQLDINRFPTLDYASNEALNTLSTNLSFTGSNVKRIMLTSCRPGEGKSFLAMNLMRSMAKIGKRVLLIDADLRHSMLVSAFNITSSEPILGLTHYLAGMCTLEDIVYQTGVANASIILAGRSTMNSLSLISDPRMAHLLQTLSPHYDTILLDAPPVGLIIDPARLATLCDGVLLVVVDGSIRRRELIEVTQQLSQTGCPILGTVLNKVSLTSGAAKRYYKGYYTQYTTTATTDKRGKTTKHRTGK